MSQKYAISKAESCDIMPFRRNNKLAVQHPKSKAKSPVRPMMRKY
jgi:hypothetical protein